MRTLARIVGTALSLFPGLPAAAQDASPEPLRAAMTATARFVDPTGAVLDQIPPGAPFRVELAFESHMGSLPATLSPMAWIRDLGPSDLPCGETAAAYRATARGALGSVDLNGSVLGILARDGAFTILDPERSIGAANLLAARRFDPAPGGIAADRRSGEFLFTLPDAGRVIAMTSYGSERVLAADLNRPEQILGAASGGAWVLERGSGNVLRLRDGAAPLRLPLQAEDVVATSAFPDATDPGRVVVRSANRLTVIEDDGRERVQLSASGVIAAALTSEAVLWLTPGNLHLAWLDAPDAPQTIPLDGTFDQIAVSPEGRIAVLYASRLSGFGLFDLALGRMVQAAGTTAPVAEIAFLPGALAIRLADNSTVGMMDLALVVPGKEAIVGPFPLGPAEAAEPRQRLLAPLLPEPTLIAVHPGRHTGFILDRRHAVSGKPPMEAMNLRGGVPQIVQVLNRGLQPQGAGRYSVAARLPRPGNWELVVSAGLGQMAFCTPLPSPPPDAAQLALREPGRIVAEPVATEPGRVRLRFLAPGGAPAAGLSGELDLASLAGSWRVLVPFSTDADGLTPDSYRVARLPAVVAWRAAPGTGFAPAVLEHMP